MADRTRRAAAGLLVSVWCAGAACGQFNSEMKPAEVEGVGVTEKLGAQAPLDLEFVNEAGETVKLAEYFGKGRPVILTLNYFRCPQLCDMTLNALVEGMREMDWTPGKDYEVVTISFNPEETSTLADAKKRAYVVQYGKEEAAAGWHFLTGKQASIEAITQGVGFGYKKQENGEFAHTATIIFLSPEGRISRYVNQLTFEGQDLRLSLVEAGEGKVGTMLDDILLMCFMYDKDRGQYVASAWKIMRLGGVASMVLLGAGLAVLWLRGGSNDAGRGSAADRLNGAGEDAGEVRRA